MKPGPTLELRTGDRIAAGVFALAACGCGAAAPVAAVAIWMLAHEAPVRSPSPSWTALVEPLFISLLLLGVAAVGWAIASGLGRTDTSRRFSLPAACRGGALAVGATLPGAVLVGVLWAMGRRPPRDLLGRPLVVAACAAVLTASPSVAWLGSALPGVLPTGWESAWPLLMVAGTVAAAQQSFLGSWTVLRGWSEAD